METFEVGVEGDHIERLAKAKPVNALSGLIWNAYDADATEVRVDIKKGDVVQLGLISISDNGNGMPREQAQEYFESLGGSWKQKTRRTEQGRAIHGLNGQGRTKAFALGKSVVWRSCNGGRCFTISGSLSDIKTFRISDSLSEQDCGCVIEFTRLKMTGKSELRTDLPPKFAMCSPFNSMRFQISRSFTMVKKLMQLMRYRL